MALVAPASPVSKQVWAMARRALEDLGYTVEEGERRSPFLSGAGAGSPRDRGRELNQLFARREIRAIWCVRGGYTAAQVLPYLDFEGIAQQPKVFLGYSDITCLHVALNQRCGFVTYHGPMAGVDLCPQPDPETQSSLQAALEGIGRFRNPGGGPLRPLCPGRAEGILTGGNLTLLAAGLGTPWALEPAGKVLFLEEVGEKVMALERMLYQLKAAGVFRQVAGVVLGTFTDCDNPWRRAYGPEELLRDFFRGFGKPVVAGVQCGHTRPNATLPLGRMCVLDGERGELGFV